MKLTTGALMLTSLALATPAVADNAEVDVYSMDETCRTDSAYEQHCFVLPESYGPSITLGEISGNPNAMKYIIEWNGWHGATEDLVIPAGVYFRIS